MRRLKQLVMGLILCIAPLALGAQATSLVGSVRVKDAVAPLTIAEVHIEALGLRTRVGELGEFAFPSLPAGRYFVTVRAIGYSPRGDSITIIAGRETRRHFELPKALTQLDTAVIVAAAQRYISPQLRGFEERMKHGAGRFITEDELRKSDNRGFQDVVRQLPGIVVMRAGQSSVAVSTRKGGASAKRALDGADPRARCYITIYQDGVMSYDPVLTPTLPPPSLEHLSVRDYAAVEFYAGEARVPAQFRSSPCGVLLLWTRER